MDFKPGKMILCFILIGLFSACASTGKTGEGDRQFEEEVIKWSNTDDVIIGIAISSLSNESDALEQVKTIAMGDLATNMEAHVAQIAENYIKIAEGRGEYEKIAEFNKGVKIIISNTIKMVKTAYYSRRRGNTYFIMYIDKDSFTPDLNTYVNEVFKETKEELDEILDN